MDVKYNIIRQITKENDGCAGRVGGLCVDAYIYRWYVLSCYCVDPDTDKMTVFGAESKKCVVMVVLGEI